MLPRTRPPLLTLAGTSVIIATGIRIAVTQTTIVTAAGRPIPLQCKSLGIHIFAMLGPGILGHYVYRPGSLQHVTLWHEIQHIPYKFE